MYLYATGDLPYKTTIIDGVTYINPSLDELVAGGRGTEIARRIQDKATFYCDIYYHGENVAHASSFSPTGAITCIYEN